MDPSPDARRALLAELFDDASMFPPAKMPLRESVAQHRRLQASDQSWMLGRLVCSAALLEELSAEAGDGPLRVTVVVLPELAWNSVPQNSPNLAVEQVESSRGGELGSHFGDATRYLEVPPGGVAATDTIDLLRTLGIQGIGVKVRCGGADASAFPSPLVLADTIQMCKRMGIRLKATAGLHDPIRAWNSADGFVHHGFVNLLAACVFADGGTSSATVGKILQEEDASAFTLDADAFTWRGMRADAQACAAMRASLLVGIGTCSFAEPVEGLAKLGMLP